LQRKKDIRQDHPRHRVEMQIWRGLLSPGDGSVPVSSFAKKSIDANGRYVPSAITLGSSFDGRKLFWLPACVFCE